ncbi:MAG: hypothetical protein M3167_10500 [Acidobacteriota bacterium]|nr:hypothetical protein [Acidobacteriota bacterium]
MKCAVAFSFLLAGCSVVLGDSPGPPPSPRVASSTLLEDLVRMTRAGTPDGSVLAYARVHRAELPAEVSDARLRWLRASGVSERVVRYMSAIDVRASALEAPEGVTDADENEGVARRRAYSGSEDDRDTGRLARSDSDYDSGGSYGGTDAYAGYDSDYAYGYGYGYEPYFGYPYPSAPYFSFVFADRGGFFRRFRHRDHRDHRDHRFDGGHRTAWRDRGGSRDSWRERRSGGRRESSIAAGPRNSGRPAFVGRGFAPRGRARAIGAGGFGPPRSGRGYASSGSRGPRGGAGGVSGFRNAAPPGGGAHPRAGGGVSRGSIGMSGGGHRGR